MRHEQMFPPTKLSVGGGCRKETIAGTHRNGRDAPFAVVRVNTFIFSESILDKRSN